MSTVSRRKGLYSVFVGHMPVDISENDIRDLFSSFGEIKDMWITLSDNGLDKYGFVRFATPQEVMEAVKLHGHIVQGKLLIVDYAHDTMSSIEKIKGVPDKSGRKSPETKKRVECTVKAPLNASGLRSETKRNKRLDYYSAFFTNMHPDVTKKEVMDLFKACGQIQDLFMDTYEDSGNKYGFVRFSNLQAVLSAVAHLHGWKMKSQSIIVDFAHDTVGRIPRNQEWGDIVPNVDISLDVSDKSLGKHYNLDYIINRSRVQETCCFLRSKMTTAKGENFTRMLERIDSWYLPSKNLAQKQCLSERCKLSPQDTSDCIKAQSSQDKHGLPHVMADVFMNKYLEVMGTVDNILKEETQRSDKKDSPQTPNQKASGQKTDHKMKSSPQTPDQKVKSSPQASSHKMKSSPHASSHKMKSSPQASSHKVKSSPQTPSHKMKSSPQTPNPKTKSSPQTHNQKRVPSVKSSPSLRTPDITCVMRSTNKSPKTSIVSDLLPAFKNELKLDTSPTPKNKSKSLLELGGMKRKKIKEYDAVEVFRSGKENNPHLKHIQESPRWEFEEKIPEAVSIEGKMNVSPLGEENLPHSSWVTDLFCQLLDKQLCGEKSNLDSKESECSLSSSETCLSSGYDSCFEGFEAHSISADPNSSHGSRDDKKYINYESKGTCLTQKSRLFDIPVK